MSKKLKKIIMMILLLATATVGIIYLAFQISPYPGAYVVRNMFSGEVEIQDEAYFEKASKKTSMMEDVVYPSEYKDNDLDIFYPNDYTEPVPVVFWVHGGGYVGGDKEGIEEFANYLVYETNVAVVSINYQPAPWLNYPGQVFQLNDAFTYLAANLQDYPMLDLSQIFFGGDSAGSQIAAQYIVAQTSDHYADEMGMEQSINQDSLKGYLSFCGPLDLIQMVNIQPNAFMMKFFINTVAWSLLGTKDWRTSPAVEQLSLVDHLTADFPSSYITDGNAYSFQEQGILFSERLQELGVKAETLFFVDDPEEVPHEYQFEFDNDLAKLNLKNTIAFIQSALGQ